MDTFSDALLIDLPTVVLSVVLLAKYGGLTFSHPAIPYLVFHLYTVTTRLIALMSGSPTLFSNWGGSGDPVTPVEIGRAALYADLALASMTAAWLWSRRHAQRPPIEQRLVTRLDPRIVWVVIFVAFTAGLGGLLLAAQIPGLETNQRLITMEVWGNSSYLFILQTWSGLALLAYIYCYGFGRTASVLLVLYLFIMTYQGFHRFRVIVPILLAVQIWLDRRGRRWPPLWMTGGLIALMALFFPLKTIGRMAQEGESVAKIGEAVTESVSTAARGESDEHVFLDQFASSLTLLDIQGRKYWGSIHLPLLTLPIPRQLWPAKPGLVGFLEDISTPSRPMKQNGMITTFLGEAYANFGLAGIFLIPPLLAAALARFRLRAYRSEYGTVMRCAWVLTSVNLVQVYRDGLNSIVVFTFVNMMPLMMMVLVHAGMGFFRNRDDATPIRTSPTEAPPRLRPMDDRPST